MKVVNMIKNAGAGCQLKNKTLMGKEFTVNLCFRHEDITLLKMTCLEIFKLFFFISPVVGDINILLMLLLCRVPTMDITGLLL